MVKKIFSLVMVISVLGAFLAGCKGSDDSASSTTTPSTTAPAAGTTGDASK